MRGLSGLRNLRLLNLSHNSITKISGLEHASLLLQLNLACNQIRFANHLEGLKELEQLDLAYNRIGRHARHRPTIGRRMRLEIHLPNRASSATDSERCEPAPYWNLGCCRILDGRVRSVARCAACEARNYASGWLRRLQLLGIAHALSQHGTAFDQHCGQPRLGEGWLPPEPHAYRATGESTTHPYMKTSPGGNFHASTQLRSSPAVTRLLHAHCTPDPRARPEP